MIPLSLRAVCVFAFILLPGGPVQLRAAPPDPYAIDERIILEANINDQPAKLVFDTGASFSALFAERAKQLGVKAENEGEEKLAGHAVKMARTQPFRLAIYGAEARTRFRIVPFSPIAGADGVLSWKEIWGSALYLDGHGRRVRGMKALPPDGWQRWEMDMESDQLFFTVTENGGEAIGRVFVDTGADIGLRLSPALWKQWRKKNPEAGVTLTTFRYAVGETMVHELGWAKEYRLGGLVFHNVDLGPIPESKNDVAIDAGGKEFVATIGMGALRHLRMIASRKEKVVLTQSVPPVPNHNRFGAVFVPAPREEGEETPRTMVARVLKGGPAGVAGLQEGDVLLEIDGMNYGPDGKGRRSHPEELFARSAGTELKVKVKRGEKTHEVAVTLRDLLP